MAVSGVNPTDWKVRKGSRPGEPTRSPETVPNQDGAGTIVAVGPGVASSRVGERVWLWEAAWHRSDGTAQELVAIAQDHAVTLPAGTSFDVGASLGIPALTAHRALTVGAEGPHRASARARSTAAPSWSPAGRARSATPPSSWPGGRAPPSSPP